MPGAGLEKAPTSARPCRREPLPRTASSFPAASGAATAAQRTADTASRPAVRKRVRPRSARRLPPPHPGPQSPPPRGKGTYERAPLRACVTPPRRHGSGAVWRHASRDGRVRVGGLPAPSPRCARRSRSCPRGEGGVGGKAPSAASGLLRAAVTAGRARGLSVLLQPGFGSAAPGMRGYVGDAPQTTVPEGRPSLRSQPVVQGQPATSGP